MIHSKVECLGLDSTFVKVYPEGTGSLKMSRLQPIGKLYEWIDNKNLFDYRLNGLPKMIETPQILAFHQEITMAQMKVLFCYLIYNDFDGKLKGSRLVMIMLMKEKTQLNPPHQWRVLTLLYLQNTV